MPSSFTTADFRVGQIPLFKDVHHRLLVALLHDDEHALLRFAQQRLVGRHARLALRHFREINLHARAARLAVSHVEHVSPAAPMSWMPAPRRSRAVRGTPRAAASRGTDRPPAPRAVLLALLREIARRERRAREPVASRLRADVENRIAHAFRRAARDLLVLQDAEAEHIHSGLPL